MDQNNELSLPVSNVPTPEVQEVIVAQNTASLNFSVLVSSALIVATGAVYGFLTLSESQSTISQTQTAAVAEAAPNPFDSIDVEAQSAFVVDLTENRIVHTKNADVQLPLASITKVMLVLAVSEVLQPEDQVTISEKAVLLGEGGSANVGEVWRVSDLIDYTLVVSSNVGAEALAEFADDKIRSLYPQAPEENAAVWRMNSLAKELGLSKTYFLNASGLDVSPTQPSAMGSARDATILLAYAYKTMPKIFLATNQSSLTTGPLDGPISVFQNTNDAIPNLPGLRIGKTGFTDLAGGNLGIVFETKPNHIFVATVLGSSQAGRFTDILAISKAAK